MFTRLFHSSTFISTLAIVAIAALSHSARADTFSTSFETEGPGTFVLGTAPLTATFTVGNAQTVGNLANYRTGLFSWHVSPGATGLITFATPASFVDLHIKDAPPIGSAVDGVGEVRAIDTSGAVIATLAVAEPFQNFNVTRTAGQTLIDRVEYENTGTVDNVMDDFSFTAVAAATPLDDPIPATIPKGTIEIDLQSTITGLAAPVWATNSPNDTTTLYVVDQQGQIIAVELATGISSVYLDVSARLVPLGTAIPGLQFDERGLLGLAFHPDFANNGLLYTYTSQPLALAGASDFSTMPPGVDADHQSVVTEWRDPDMGNPTLPVDPLSARELLRVDEPQFNHNAGALAFDSNSLLYIAFGDGGGADDEGVGHGTGNGQDPTNPLGAILRIDPTAINPANFRYGIPAGNPFVGVAGMVEEIFAYGFRNPFRMSFDPVTGDLWVADVGQNDIEEIDIVTAGGNYGWKLKEGSFFFDGNGAGDGFVTNVDPGVPAGLIDPVAEYDHDEGIAIIGGFVYRGSRFTEAQGRYVFGDFATDFATPSGRLFYLDAANAIQEIDIFGRVELGEFLLGMGVDGNGEIYVLSNTTGTPFGTTGTVYLAESSAGTVAFDDDTAAVDENVGNATVTVERTGGIAGAASVDYATADGTASAGSDYTATNGTLSWMDGEAGPKTFTVAITEETDVDTNETFTVTLSNALGAALGATATQTITINNNDQAPPRRRGGGSIGWPALLLLGLVGLRRRTRTRR